MSYITRIKVVSLSLLVVVAAGVGLALTVYSSYASLAESDREMVRAYKQYASKLKTQRELVPDLVEIVHGVTLKSYPEYRELQEISARAEDAKKIQEGVAVQNRFAAVLDRVISVADSYPQLRSGHEYSMVLDEFRAAEGRAAIERLRYNDAAIEFNNKLHSFPGNVVSQVFSVAERPLLKAPGRLGHTIAPVTD